MTIYFAIQWFIYTDHSLPESANDQKKKQEHDDIFKAESIVSIAILCSIRIVQVCIPYENKGSNSNCI